MRRRILLLVAGLTVLVVLAFAVPIAILIRSAVAQRADESTTAQARSAGSFLRVRSYTTKEIQAYVSSQTRSTRRPMSITLPDGTTVGSTPVNGDSTPSRSGESPGGYGGFLPGGGGGAAPGAGGAGAAQLNSVPGGQLATSFAPAANGAYLVRVFLSDDARYQGTHGWYLLLAGGSVGLLLIALGAGELLTRRIARPLVDSAATAQQLAAGDTTARAPTDGPREVADVGIALNRLADRIDELIAEERETVADLSHRLRTPLTTLRLDAEALHDPGEAERVGLHVGELERTLTAVIRAARRPQREGRLPSCDATTVVRERVAFWSALTEDQGRRSTVDLPSAPLPVRAAAEDLAAATDALLENVVAHTEEGTDFAVRLVATDSGAQLDIADDGTGIPPEADVRGRSDRGSSGLGLDIARRAAEAGGGSMRIGRAPSGGALVTLLLRGP